jgi:nucleolin
MALTGTEVDGREIRVDISAPKPKQSATGRVDKPTSSPAAILFMGNLSFNVTEEEIRSTFGEHGSILSCRFPTDRETGAFKGFGYLEFSSVEEATSAVQALNGKDIAGRAIRLDYSQPRDNAAGGAPRGRGKIFY